MTKNNFILIIQKVTIADSYILFLSKIRDEVKDWQKKVKADFKWDKRINFTLKWKVVFGINVENYPRRKFINHPSSR